MKSATVRRNLSLVLLVGLVFDSFLVEDEETVVIVDDFVHHQFFKLSTQRNGCRAMLNEVW